MRQGIQALRTTYAFARERASLPALAPAGPALARGASQLDAAVHVMLRSSRPQQADIPLLGVTQVLLQAPAPTCAWAVHDGAGPTGAAAALPRVPLAPAPSCAWAVHAGAGPTGAAAALPRVPLAPAPSCAWAVHAGAGPTGAAAALPRVPLAPAPSCAWAVHAGAGPTGAAAALPRVPLAPAPSCAWAVHAGAGPTGAAAALPRAPPAPGSALQLSKTAAPCCCHGRRNLERCPGCAATRFSRACTWASPASPAPGSAFSAAMATLQQRL